MPMRLVVHGPPRVLLDAPSHGESTSAYLASVGSSSCHNVRPIATMMRNDRRPAQRAPTYTPGGVYTTGDECGPMLPNTVPTVRPVCLNESVFSGLGESTGEAENTPRSYHTETGTDNINESFTETKEIFPPGYFSKEAERALRANRLPRQKVVRSSTRLMWDARVDPEPPQQTDKRRPRDDDFESSRVDEDNRSRFNEDDRSRFNEVKEVVDRQMQIAFSLSGNAFRPPGPPLGSFQPPEAPVSDSTREKSGEEGHETTSSEPSSRLEEAWAGLRAERLTQMNVASYDCIATRTAISTESFAEGSHCSSHDDISAETRAPTDAFTQRNNIGSAAERNNIGSAAERNNIGSAAERNNIGSAADDNDAHRESASLVQRRCELESVRMLDWWQWRRVDIGEKGSRPVVVGLGSLGRIWQAIVDAAYCVGDSMLKSQIDHMLLAMENFYQEVFLCLHRKPQPKAEEKPEQNLSLMQSAME